MTCTSYSRCRKLAKGSLSYRIRQEGVQGCPGGFMDDDARVIVRWLLLTMITRVHTTGLRQKKQGS